jgi:hypothetical protein
MTPVMPASWARLAVVTSLWWCVCLAVLPGKAERTTVHAPEPVSSRVQGNRVWLSSPYRHWITASMASYIPATANVHIQETACYFVELGNGSYELRAVSAAVHREERVVTDGAFLLKSELLR